ncbi:hypothetical protein AMECASPLE_030022 [Ameca splendens]|uniref:Uncharacterized protein n=1 Tax=Ameca splendens TaxID=208324 RepID=A0ABV0XIW5_9TELE
MLYFGRSCDVRYRIDTWSLVSSCQLCKILYPSLEPCRNRVETVSKCAVMLDMSLENFFSMPKKGEVRRKRSVFDANAKQGSHVNLAAPACEGNTDRESDTMQD